MKLIFKCKKLGYEYRQIPDSGNFSTPPPRMWIYRKFIRKTLVFIKFKSYYFIFPFFISKHFSSWLTPHLELIVSILVLTRKMCFFAVTSLWLISNLMNKFFIPDPISRFWRIFLCNVLLAILESLCLL